MALCGGDGIASVEFADQDQQVYYSAQLSELAGEDAENIKEQIVKNTVEVHSVNTDRYAPYIVEGFTATQHMQVVDTLKWLASRTMKEYVNTGGNDPSQGVPEPYVIRHIKAAIDNLIQRNQVRDNEELAQEFQDIKNNFEQFWAEVKREFKQLGLEQEQGHFYPASGSLHDRHFWEDMGRFLVSEKNTASSNVKIAMSFIPRVEFKRDENGNIVEEEDGTPVTVPQRNYLGTPSFYRMTEAWNLTASLLADQFPRTPENMLESLREIGNRNSTALQVWKKISSQPEKVQRDFANALAKHYAKFKLVFGSENRDGSYAMRPIRSDRLSREQALLSQWQDDFLSEEGITYRDENGVYRVDQDQVRDIKSALENLSENMDRSSIQYAKKVRDALGALGIDLPLEYLEAAQEGEGKLDKSFDFEFGQLDNNGNFKSNSVLGRVFEALLEPRVDEQGNEIEGDPKASKVNPATNAISAPALRTVARGAIDYRTEMWAPSFTNVENKRLYALQDHEPITKNFARLQDFSSTRRLIQDPFRNHSPLLRNLMGMTLQQEVSDDTLPESEEDMGNIEQSDREDLLDRIDFGYIDGISIEGQRQGQTIDNLSPRDHKIQKISFFQNQGRDERIFQGPTLSDKTRSYILTLPSYQTHYGSDYWSLNITEEDGNARLEIPDGEGLDVKEALYDAALSEVGRIDHVQEWLEDNEAEAHPQGRAYVEASQLFHLFPELNEHNIENKKLRKAIWTDGRLNDPRTNQASRQAIKEILTNKAVRDIEAEYVRWKQEGLDGFMNTEYMKEQTPYNPRSERGLMYAVADQYLNYKAFYPDAFRLMHFDPAEASKWESGQDPEDTVRLTLGNFQKRLGGSMSPSISHGMPENATFDKATLLDRFVTSDFIEDHRQVFKETVGVENAEGYEGIESTDAQEYVTLSEYLEVAHAHGQISKELKDRIQRRISAAQTRRGPDDYRLTEDELDQILFQPHKPVYFGQRWDPDLNQMFQVYTKSSAFPLIPQVTEGTELDNLRQEMEERGIDRVAYQSADKLGAVNPQQIYNEDGSMDPDSVGDALEASRQTLTRDGFGLQFLVPNKADNVPMQTQLNKLFMADIVDADGIDAESIWNRKQEIRQRMFEIKRENLEDRLGAEQMDDGSYKLDPQALKDIVLQEARERDWNPVFIQEIENLTEEDMDSMLSFTGASSQIESLLLSLVEDVVKPEMHGRPYVQQSSAGLKWEQATESGEVAFAPDFDPTTGLGFINTQRNEDGKNEVEAAEIVVGWHFKDEDGNPIPMEEYTTMEDGKKVLDMDKIEEDLLKGVGYRIPFQGPNSSLPVKIAGFMPPETGVQAFVPDDIVTQMGSDFDVDKLWTYLRQYRVEDGEIVGIDENASELDQLKEEYIETLEDVLYNASDEVQAQIRKPLDQSDLKDEISRIQDEVGRRGRNTFTHFNRQAEDYINQKAGKDLIGITSLWSQMEAVFQHHNIEHNPGDRSSQIELSARVRSKGTGVKTVELDRAGGPAEISSETSGRISLQDGIRLFQNAAVDNAKENILGPLGINTINANVAMHMLLLNDGSRGIDLEHVTRLMNQPIIRDTVELAREIQSIFSVESPFEALSTAVEQMREQRSSQGWPEVNPTDASTLPPASPVPGSPEPNLLEDMERQPDNPQWQERQMKYLEFFDQVRQQASDMSDIRGAFMYGDRNGPGSSLLDARSRYNEIFTLPTNNWEGIMEIGGDIEMTDDHFKQAEFIPDTELGHATKNSVILADDLFYNAFAYGNSDFQHAVNELGQPLKDRELSATEKERVFKDYKSFVISGAYNQTERSSEESLSDMRQRLLFGNEDQADLATRILEARGEGWGRDRMILDFLEVETPNYENALKLEKEDDAEVKPEPAQIDFRYMKMEDQDRMRLLHSVAEMLSSPRDAERELMRDLVLYTMFVRGRQHSPSTMADLIPPAVLEDLGIKSAMKNLQFEGDNRTWSQDIFKTQYIQHNPEQAYQLDDDMTNILPGPGTNMRSHFNIEESNLQAQFTEEFIEREGIGVEDALSDLFRYDAEGKIEARDFISVYDQNAGRRRLWEYIGDGEYQEIPVLGSGTRRTGVGLEYDTRSRIADSVILPQYGVKKTRKAPIKSSRETSLENMEFVKEENLPGRQTQGPAPPPPSGPTSRQTQVQEKTDQSEGFKKYVKQRDQSLVEVIRNINRDSDLPEHIREVSRVLTNMSPGIMQNVEVRLFEDPTGPEGGFARGDNRIGLNTSASRPGDPNYEAKVTLHESIHAVTNSKIESYQQVKDGEISRSESGLTDLQYRALSDLDNLHQTAKGKITQEIREETDYSPAEIDRMIEQILDQEEEFTVQDIPQDARDVARRRYGVWNVREFASHLMSEEDFQRWANEQQVDDDLNIPQRFAQLIQRIIRAMAEEFGIDNSRPTLLSRGVESVILSVGFDQQIDSGSQMDNNKVVGGTLYKPSSTSHNKVRILKYADGSREVQNLDGNALSQENQTTILQDYDGETNSGNSTQPPPPSGDAPTPPPPGEPDIDQRIPDAANIGESIEEYSGTGRREMDETVGEFIDDLTVDQRRTFRRLRKQIRTRCD